MIKRTSKNYIQSKLAENKQWNILDIGCGWGSLTCFMAKKFPSSKITAVSNSKDQKLFIENNRKLELEFLSLKNFYKKKEEFL